MDSVADTTDMVKVITLQAKDNSNNNVSHILNGKTIKLSQHFGISKMLDVFFIPGDTSMYYLAGKSNPAIGVHNLTWKEVFDYDTGDVFHYYSELGMPATDIIYIIETVVNKVIKGNYDTIIYTIDVCSRTYSFGEPSNYLNTITQTIVSADSAYSDLQSLPEQFSPLTFWDSYQNRHSGDFGNYNQRMSKRIETGYYERMNSCWAYGIFDSYDSYTYAKGLGCTNYVYNEGDPSNYLINSLVYFKKGSETWGTPVAMDCYDLLDGINKLQKDNFHLFIVPNPVETQARITISGLDKNDPGTFLLYDIAGREIVRMKISSNPFTFDRTGLTSGLYLLSVINQQGEVIARDKIIIK